MTAETQEKSFGKDHMKTWQFGQIKDRADISGAN
jgi:hypothetical protein